MKAADTRLADMMWWAIRYVLTPVIAVFVLVTSPGSLGHAWAAAQGGGLLGTLQVQRKDCGYHRVVGYRCTGLYGSYRSDDGTVGLTNAYLDGIPDGAGPGSQVRVRFTGDRHPPVVYRASGSLEWLLIAGFMLASVVALVVWALTVWARLSGRVLPWWFGRPQRQVLRSVRAPDKTGHTASSGSGRRKRAARNRRRSAR